MDHRLGLKSFYIDVLFSYRGAILYSADAET